MSRIFPAVTVTTRAEASIKAGHPWVYDTEIEKYSEEIQNGALADAFSRKGAYLGTGLISEKSKIRLRILSRDANETFSEAFFARRIGYALDYRLTVMKSDFACCRLIFGEADGLPGLTVDRYNDILSVQTMSYGMEARKEMLFSSLTRELKSRGAEINGIFERNDSNLREREGLTQNKGWWGDVHPESAVTEIKENGIYYSVDVENGQKTGFFLDQKYNRAALGKISDGKTVLDCFTHTGSFAFNAVIGGAKHVTAVDVSDTAIEMARHNAKRNGFEDKIDFVCADVFDYLPKAERKYDLVILDPPAFTKSRKTASNAEKGYKEINYRAMKLLPRGGYLATCSCSHFMTSEMFLKMLAEAAFDANVSIKMIEERRQSPDHPILLGVPETDYLKFYMMQTV